MHGIQITSSLALGGGLAEMFVLFCPVVLY